MNSSLRQFKNELRKSKTDQEGQRIKKGILYGENLKTCPVVALKYWLEIVGIGSGVVFRSFDIHGNLKAVRLSDKGIALIVKRYIKKMAKMKRILQVIRCGADRLSRALLTALVTRH